MTKIFILVLPLAVVMGVFAGRGRRPAAAARPVQRQTVAGGGAGATCGSAVVLGVEVELDRVGALGRGGAEDHRLEGSLQVQPSQPAGAVVAHDLAGAGVAGTGAGAADGDAAGPAVDGAGEGSGVVGGERAVG